MAHVPRQTQTRGQDRSRAEGDVQNAHQDYKTAGGRPRRAGANLSNKSKTTLVASNREVEVNEESSVGLTRNQPDTLQITGSGNDAEAMGPVALAHGTSMPAEGTFFRAPEARESKGSEADPCKTIEDYIEAEQSTIGNQARKPHKTVQSVGAQARPRTGTSAGRNHPLRRSRPDQHKFAHVTSTEYLTREQIVDNV